MYGDSIRRIKYSVKYSHITAYSEYYVIHWQTDVLAISSARLRLSRWGEAVNIYDDPKLDRPDATAIEIRTAKETLLQILALFADTEEISRKYELTANASESLDLLSATDIDPAIMALRNWMKNLAIKRQKRSRFFKLTSWALYHRAEFQQLIDSVVLLIDNIEKLFPAPQAQIMLVRQEAAEIGDKASLELIENAAKGVDGLLRKAAQ
jgi:hypothetical protein